MSRRPLAASRLADQLCSAVVAGVGAVVRHELRWDVVLTALLVLWWGMFSRGRRCAEEVRSWAQQCRV